MANQSIALQQNISMALAHPGAMGTIEAYISAVNRIPLLTPDEEKCFAEKLQSSGDLNAARSLILSHLRLVVSIARQYLGYGLPHADLIQEGNIGLMKAVKRFDHSRGVRLVSFAVHWIKAEINEYIIRNWRLVKVATTKAQRKLFFNLRSMRPDGQTLDPEHIEGIAAKLNVRPEDVSEMQVRLSGRDMALDSHDDDDDFAPINYLSDEGAHSPDHILAQNHRFNLQTTGIATALEKLDARARHIIEARWLQDEGEGKTLQELASEYNISAERVRQIENAAIKKMRAVIEAQEV